MKIKTQLLAACVAGVCAVSAAQAQVAGTGLYVGGSVGQSKWKGGDFPGLDSSKVGGKLYAGYEFTPNLALELGYTEFGRFKYTGSSIKANGLWVDAVGKLPFTEKFSGLARVGVFNGQLKAGGADDRGTSWKAGVGAQYDLTPNVAIRGEYERYRFDALGGNPKADTFTVGVNYKF